MRYFGAIILLLMASTLACTLSDSTVDNQHIPTATTSQVFAVSSTQTPSPTATATAQAYNSENTSGSSNTNTSSSTSNCVPRSDWVQYRVVQGDTLGTIAQRTNSSVQQLTTGNCLSNPNQISVGQTLYVPQAPVVQQNNNRIGSIQLSFSPYLRLEGGSYEFEGNSTTTITAHNLPATAASVEFFIRPTGTGIDFGDLIGTDNNLSNGASVQWKVNSWILAHINAEAKNASGTVVASSDFILVYAEDNEPVGIPSSPFAISPFVVGEGNQFQLQPGATVTISTYSPPGDAVAINYYYRNAAPGSVRTSIGSATNLTSGSAITWQVPSGSFSGQIEADYVRADGSALYLGYAQVFGD